MRKDIGIDVETGDLILSNAMERSLSYPLTQMGEEDDCVYLRVVLPRLFDPTVLFKSGVRVQGGYVPVYKKVKVYFVLDYGNEEDHKVVMNPADNGLWFGAYEPDGVKAQMASELVLTNVDFCFFIRLSDTGRCCFYSGCETDLVVRPALEQNKAFLLKCRMSNNYLFPTSGVGLIHFLNGVTDGSELGARLQREFWDDGMGINNASIDPETGELRLEAKEL